MTGMTVVARVNGFNVELTCYKNGKISLTPEELKQKIVDTNKHLESKNAQDAAQEIVRRMNMFLMVDSDIHQYSVIVTDNGVTYSAYSWSW